MLERLTNPEELNIKDVVVEPGRESRIVFEPEKEISSEKWAWLGRWLDIYEESGEWEKYVNTAADMKQLGRSVPISEEKWQKINEELARTSAARRSNTWSNLGVDVSLKLLGREMEFSQEDWDRIDNSLQNNRKNGRRLAILAAAMKSLGRPVNLTPEDRVCINSEVANEAKDKSGRGSFGGIAIAVKTLGFQIDLDDDDYKVMKDDLESRRTGEYYSQGAVELVKLFPSDFETSQANSPLPEERNF